MLEQRNLSDVAKEVGVQTSGSIMSVKQTWTKTLSQSLRYKLMMQLLRSPTSNTIDKEQLTVLKVRTKLES